MEQCNDKIKITGYGIIKDKKWNKIIKQTTMKKQPNPALKNTAIYVGNDEVLRKKAIEYYEANGYQKQSDMFDDDPECEYLCTIKEKGNNTFNFYQKQIVEYFEKTIITLPTETETEYPKMMIVWNDSMDIDYKEYKLNVIGELNGKFITKKSNSNRDLYSWDNAKPIPTATLTVAELVKFYEKSNNVKVEVK